MPNKEVDLNKWSVIACDQFTSDTSYWDRLFDYTNGVYSSLYLIYPEAYLQNGNQDSYISKINQTMIDYLNEGIFDIVNDYVLTVRSTAFGKTRKGLMTLIDLDCYDPFGKLDIRATERTVRERLPLRVKIRENATLELPHVMLLIDDRDKEVIEKTYENLTESDLLYDFELNSNGGNVKGYRVKNGNEIENRLKSVAEKHSARKDLSDFYLAVGDGNHSLAAARECWLNIKKGLNDREIENHPSRYALVEMVNLFDEGITFEPIHRIIKNADSDFVSGLDQKEGKEIKIIENNILKTIKIKGTAPEIIATVQNYIDAYLQTHKDSYQDYLHGDEHTAEAVKDGGIAIFMPCIEKDTFFKYINDNGVLTRKAFSMGEAEEKRYYLESRIIK